MSLADLDAAIEGALPPVNPAPAPRPTQPEPEALPAGPGWSEAKLAKKALIELRLREMEALRLYEPLPKIDAEFHRSRSQIRSIRGSNRSSKTTGAAVEIARAVTNSDPYSKFPATNGRVYAVGHTEIQVAEVLYKKLFKPDAFKIIRDEHTGQWRVYRPWTDKHRERERRPAPPLIPRRFIKGEPAWKDKKLGVPQKVELTTGWTIHFFASGGIPPQGMDIDLWWIDEECDNQAWYTELCARILDRKGRGVWSATPQVANPQLYELHLRSKEEAAKADPQVTECYVLLADNPYIDDEDKEKFAANMTDEERRVRIEGEFRLTGFKVYPEFSMKIHGFDAPDDFQVPLDWSRYMVVDPGRQVCAVLFAAVPPPTWSGFDGKSRDRNFVLLYDELYIEQCDADKFGRMVASKSDGIVYERFLIDSHAGRVPDMGYGVPVQVQYSQALKRHGVESRIGQSFVPGNDEVSGGILKVREWLRLREDGTPKLRVRPGRLRKLEWELARYHYKRVKVHGELMVADEPEKRNDHSVDCLRYLCSYEPKWIKPKKGKKHQSPAVRMLQKKKDRARKKAQQDGGGAIRLGPRRAA